jgi:CcmD family protein
MRKTFAVCCALIFFAVPALAQTTPPDEPVQMADALHASGKIYVVVAVVVVILAGLFSYLIYLDRKISRLEKK